MFDPTCPEDREQIACEAYYRDRAAEAAVDREHNLNPHCEYFALSWESISDHAKRPYRTAVEACCDVLSGC